MDIDEEIIEKFEQLSDCGYMQEDISKIINAVIEVYNGSEAFGDIIPAEDCMRMISTLREAQKDYAFFAKLKVDKKFKSVLDSASGEG